MSEITFYVVSFGITAACMWGIHTGRIWTAILIASVLCWGVLVPMTVMGGNV